MRCFPGCLAATKPCPAGPPTWASSTRAGCRPDATRRCRGPTSGSPSNAADGAMKALYDVPAPAKLNLFLHITGRRPDGYHLLQSAFMLIDWCDTLHFELREDGRLSREDLSTPLPADDLVLRAARLLQATGRTSLGAHIGIEKRIPAQAGMGGG